jgi:exonuclease SbcD
MVKNFEAPRKAEKKPRVPDYTKAPVQPPTPQGRPPVLRILHTSDWHLGRQLHKTRQRYDEFGRFLDFLLETLISRQVDCLLVAGDVFDTTTPSNRASSLYYGFLSRLAAAPACRHVVVVAGNHDSPTFLEAPAPILGGLGVHVVGSPTPEREVIVLSDPAGRPELIVCAVPYLRDADLKKAVYGESAQETGQALAAALMAHYEDVHQRALAKRAELGAAIPIVATGHLFLAGGQVETDDGVREIHAGPLAALPAERLPKFDYLALGHLHGPQRAGGSETVRYSGSPIPMSFGEAKKAKSLCLVELGGTEPRVELAPIPVFQRLARLEGDLAALIKGLRGLSGTGAWLELVHQGTDATGDPRPALEEEALRLGLEIIRIRDERFRSLAMAADEAAPDLASLAPESVFESLLAGSKVPEELKIELKATHARVLAALLEEDVRSG